MPVHNGHVFLIETALSLVEHLTILVIAQPDDPIPKEVRVSWLCTLFPSTHVMLHNTPLPRDESGVEHWGVWLQSIKSTLNNSLFDTVFSSEQYGVRFAQDIGAQHHMVDHKRVEVPISASAIRAHPHDYTDYLPEIVRSYYSQKSV